MYNDKYLDRHFSLIREDEKTYFEDYQKLLARREAFGATYHQEPVPTLYEGFYYDKKTWELFSEMVETFMGIVKKVTEKYLEDASYRKIFDLDPLIEKLILKDPAYDLPVPIARIDVMYDGRKDYKFCEFNTDGSSAMLEDKALADLFKESKIYKALSKDYKLENIDLIESLVDSIIKIHGGRPNIAIVDIIEFDNIEFTTIKKAFEKRGLRAEICDVRDLEKRSDGTYYRDMKIDLVYRRLVTSDLLPIKEEAEGFIEGYLAGDFMTIGSFRSTLFYTKDIFRILRLPESLDILTDREKDFVKDHIPFTENFDYERDRDMLLKNKDKYILKPKLGYASSGIFVGKEETGEDFGRKLEEIKDKDYIYQEYYQVEPMQFTTFDEGGRAGKEDFSYVIGLFSYGGDFISTYMRIGQKALISSASTYYTLPSFLVEEK